MINIFMKNFLGFYKLKFKIHKHGVERIQIMSIYKGNKN